MTKLLLIKGSLGCILVLLLVFGCSTKNKNNPNTDSICLVLSVGAQKGLAHIGAIEALQDLGYSFDYVYGNSAGSIVGAVYANNPNANMKKEFSKLLKIYESKTYKQAENNTILGGVVGILYSSNPWVWLGAGVLGGTTTDKIDFDRFQDTLFDYFKGKNIADLELPYSTSYWDFNNIDEYLKVSKNELVSDAVSYSCMNPFIFPEHRQIKKMKIDAGADRLASTPILDAYNSFKPKHIIAINVSSQDAIYPSIDCQVDEIKVNAKSIECNIDDIKVCIDDMYNEGYNAVLNYFNNSND